MIFETKRLYVTKWKPRDLDALHELYNDTAIKEFILPLLTIEETRCIFENQLNHFKKDEKKKGVEIGYSLIKNYWKKGYATEIVKESIAWIFKAKGFSSIYAVTGLYNENSKNVLLKCGFHRKENFTENGEEMNLFGILKEDIPVLQ